MFSKPCGLTQLHNNNGIYSNYKSSQYNFYIFYNFFSLTSWNAGVDTCVPVDLNMLKVPLNEDVPRGEGRRRS